MPFCPTCKRAMPEKAPAVAQGNQAPNLDEIMLLERGKMSEWEASFVESIKRRKTLSEKQHACYVKIRDKYLMAPIEPKSKPIPEDMVDIPF